MPIVSNPPIAFIEPDLQWSTVPLAQSSSGALGFEDPCIFVETQPWLLLGLQTPPPPPPPPVIVITGVSPGVIGQQGGIEIVITATGLVEGTDYEVFIGPNGDATDEPAFAGLGWGYLAQPVGNTLTVYSPISGTGALFVTVRQGSDIATFPLTVIERNWSSAQFEMRQSFPPWYVLGARRLDLEDPL